MLSECIFAHLDIKDHIGFYIFSHKLVLQVLNKIVLLVSNSIYRHKIWLVDNEIPTNQYRFMVTKYRWYKN